MMNLLLFRIRMVAGLPAGKGRYCNPSSQTHSQTHCFLKVLGRLPAGGSLFTAVACHVLRPLTSTWKRNIFRRFSFGLVLFTFQNLEHDQTKTRRRQGKAGGETPVAQSYLQIEKLHRHKRLFNVI